MSGTLTARQSEELVKAMLDYLASQKFNNALDGLKIDAHQADYVYDQTAKNAGLLEKKWTGVIRLQKKIMDLEARNSQMAEELAALKANPAAAAASSRTSPDWLPRAPSRHTLTGHRAQINRVAFHPVYNTLVTASDDSSIKVWDWESGEFERTVKGHTKSVTCCTYDTKGDLLVSCSSDLTIKIWAAADDYKNTKTLYGHDHSISTVAFMPGDDFVVSASRDKTVRLWEVVNGYCVKTFTPHADWIRSVEPSPDGRFLITASNDHTSKLIDARTGDVKLDLRGHENVIETAIFAPLTAHAAIRELASIPAPKSNAAEALFIATASRDKQIRIWDGQSGQCLATFTGHDNWVRALVFHPSGQHLFSASDDKCLKIWELKTGRCIRTIEAHSHFITCLTWGRTTVSTSILPTGDAGILANGEAKTETRRVNVLATGSVDQSIKIWLP